LGVAAPPEPLVNLLPGQTWFVCSASKATAPGLRIGFLLCPDAASFDAISFQMRAECFSPSALPSVVAAQWMSDGTARSILSEIATESARRVTLAGSILGEAIARPSFPTSLHVWLPMDELPAERVLNTALRSGVTLTPPAAIALPGGKTTGLRLCLNNPQSSSRLTTALEVIRSAMSDRQETTII
jgi:DNA-binding transcriptional MocR family regulator